MNDVAERYIDVVGESTVTEKPVLYSADLALRVIAPSNAKALEEMADLLKTAIKKLIGVTGLTADQVIDGGADVWPAGGDDHMKGSKCVVQWIKVRAQERKILSKALNEMDGVFIGNNHSYSYRIRFPEFSAASAFKAKALNKAMEDARTKAMVIANATDINLGGIVQVRELDVELSASDYFDDCASETGAFPAMSDKSGRFIPVERIRPVRCRVRFAIDPVQ